MNKMFLVGVMVFVALNIVAEEHNFSHPEIIIRIDKNGLDLMGLLNLKKNIFLT